MTRITRSYIAPNPKEFDYWVDLAADTKVTINNTLTSTSTTEALAAAQGKALKDLIDALTTRVAALETPAA